jgi:hypothetical protein
METNEEHPFWSGDWLEELKKVYPEGNILGNPENVEK